MNIRAFSAFSISVFLAFSLSGPALAQPITSSYALKSGESVDINDLYWVANCKSLLTAPPEVTIMDGPPGVSAEVKEAMVVPRVQQCAKPVKGGILTLKADNIEDESNTVVTLRIRYKTKDGVRDKSMSFNLALFP